MVGPILELNSTILEFTDNCDLFRVLEAVHSAFSTHAIYSMVITHYNEPYFLQISPW